jgi:hypothetical protein
MGPRGIRPLPHRLVQRAVGFEPGAPAFHQQAAELIVDVRTLCESQRPRAEHPQRQLITAAAFGRPNQPNRCRCRIDTREQSIIRINAGRHSLANLVGDGIIRSKARNAVILNTAL